MFKTILTAACLTAAMAGAASAATLLDGVFEINIHNFADTANDSGVVTQGNSAATAANVANVARNATVTWTGTLNFGLLSSGNGATSIADFFASNGTGGALSNVDAAELSFLNDTQLSLNTYVQTTFFDITGVFAGNLSNGLITHDDGITLVANNQTGGVSAPPTAQRFTNFTADAGAFRLIYAAANGNPSVLRVTGDVAPVPLPAALPLLLAGFGALGVASRRKKKQSA